MARRKNPETEAAVDLSEAQPSEALPEATPEVAAPDDPVAEALSDPEPTVVTPPAPPPPPPVHATAQGPSFLGPVLGGALAAVAGFALSHFNAFGIAPQDNGAELAALASRISALEAAPAPEAADLSGLETSLADLQARIAALEEAPAQPAPDLSALETLDQRLAAIEAIPATGGDASTAALAAKLAELERRLATLPTEGVDTTEVDAALARLEAAEAEATARATAAAEAAAAAERALTLDRLRAATATDAPFKAELQALGDADLTAALAPHAAGVATLASLQEAFPDLVRTALDVARAAEGDTGWTARVTDFLAAQTGARPLSPQEGTTPAAILSRADFAVSEGRLADALAEIATLPPDVQAVFADWSARANARLAVDTALEGQ
jgi:hypothetical protein